jgi:hypothetical protein
MTVTFSAHAHLMAREGASWPHSYPVRERTIRVSMGPGNQPYGRTPKFAPHIWLPKTVPLEYFDSVHVVSCGRGVPAG